MSRLARTILGLCRTLLNAIGSLLRLRLAGSDRRAHKIYDPLCALLNLGIEGPTRRRSAIPEVIGLIARESPELVDAAALVRRHAIRVKVVLELALAPCLERRGLGRAGGRCEVRRDGSVGVTAAGRSLGVLVLGSFQEVVTCGGGARGNLLVLGLEVFPVGIDVSTRLQLMDQKHKTNLRLSVVQGSKVQME